MRMSWGQYRKTFTSESIVWFIVGNAVPAVALHYGIYVTAVITAFMAGRFFEQSRTY